VIPIDKLPDETLLGIFAISLPGYQPTKREIEAWQTLAYVCRRWRVIVLGSPQRLNLRLCCTPDTPREMLDFWPVLPLLIHGYAFEESKLDCIIAACARSDRVCEIDLSVSHNNPQLGSLLAAMQEPFPLLTNLTVFASDNEMAPPLPDSFLGGSAQRLRSILLTSFPYPGLPMLLSSTTHLVSLHLENISHSGYISPETMVTCLAVLTSLESLHLEFPSPRSRPHQNGQHPPPQRRSVLPALTSFFFEGLSEYLEDLAARIDAPQLDSLRMNLLHGISFDTPQLAQFVTRIPRLSTHKEACVYLDDSSQLRFSSPTPHVGELVVGVSHGRVDRELSSLARICTTSFLPLVSAVENLYIVEFESWQSYRQDDIDIEGFQWLELLRPFTAVKNLYLHGESTRHTMIAFTLNEPIWDETTDVFPGVQNIFLDDQCHEAPGPVQEVIEQFAATRQLSGHTIAVSPWDVDWCKLNLFLGVNDS
jgi:hypothetical protein